MERAGKEGRAACCGVDHYGDVEEDKIVPVDPTDPYGRYAYKILKLNDEIFEYESLEPANKYTVRRVPSGFEFPE